jgi:catechol 2,3-dioxygenase-like lactoylglutathione lyase family enzyme
MTQFLAAEPQLFVAEIERALRFYTERLGFEIGFSYGDPPFYAQVVRGSARINFRCVDGAVFDPSLREREREGDVLAATVALDAAGPLFEEYRATGVVFHQVLRTEAWGAETFIVADPDGNLIAFAGPA